MTEALWFHIKLPCLRLKCIHSMNALCCFLSIAGTLEPLRLQTQQTLLYLNKNALTGIHSHDFHDGLISGVACR